MGAKDATNKAGESFFKKMAASMWNGLVAMIPHATRAFFESTKRDLPGAADQGFAVWTAKLAARGVIDADTAALLGDVEKAPFPVDLIQAMLIRIKILTNEVDSRMAIYNLDRQYAHLATTTPNPAPADNLIRAMIIDPQRTTANRAHLAKFGYDSTQIDNMILSYYRTVEENTIRACFLRGIISDELMYERMRELGYTDTRTKEIIQTWELIPGPQDLFTMVAKEAFEPDIYRPLGLDREFPAAQVEWLQKQGISQAWAEKYWIAHWDQPSIGQGFEMLHRGVITPAELNLLFRAVEIPDFWRDKLTQIAYNPYTRVDVRRMHDKGILSNDELIRSYMDLGFSPEKALKMAEFTVSFNADHIKELTRAAIIESYEVGLISRANAKSLLMAQEYSDDLAEYYLTLSDYKTDQETQDLLFENIRERFLLGEFTETQVRNQLSSMNVQGDKIDALIDKWLLKRWKYQQLPSVSDLEDFLSRGLITETQYRSVMSRHGYNPAHIDLYLNRINQPEPVRDVLPTKGELRRFLINETITEDQYRTRMELKGYSQFHIDLYLYDMEVVPDAPVDIEISRVPSKGELGRFFIKRIITEAQYRTQMQALGYTDDNITRFEFDLGRMPSRADLGRFYAQALLSVAQYQTYMSLLGYSDVDIAMYRTEIENKMAAGG